MMCLGPSINVVDGRGPSSRPRLSAQTLRGGGGFRERGVRYLRLSSFGLCPVPCGTAGYPLDPPIERNSLTEVLGCLVLSSPPPR